MEMMHKAREYAGAVLMALFASVTLMNSFTLAAAAGRWQVTGSPLSDAPFAALGLTLDTVNIQSAEAVGHMIGFFTALWFVGIVGVSAFALALVCQHLAKVTSSTSLPR